MKHPQARTILIILVQIFSIMLYPRSFIQEFPQSFVLPPILLGLFILTLIGLYTRVISILTGRISMVLVMGINIVMRVVTFFPNVKNAENQWYFSFVLFTILSIAFSWFSIVQLEKNPIKPALPNQKPLS